MVANKHRCNVLLANRLVVGYGKGSVGSEGTNIYLSLSIATSESVSVVPRSKYNVPSRTHEHALKNLVPENGTGRIHGVLFLAREL